MAKRQMYVFDTMLSPLLTITDLETRETFPRTGHREWQNERGSEKFRHPRVAHQQRLLGFADKVHEKWEDNKGKCKAVHMFMTLMSLVEYHSDPYIRGVMRAQVIRVGEAWEFLEKEVLVNSQFWDPVAKISVPFKERGLKKRVARLDATSSQAAVRYFDTGAGGQGERL
jgi:hypothetical protein